MPPANELTSSSSDDDEERRVFVSYAREDSDAAIRIHKFLTENGLLPWLDREEILAGQNWKDEIENAMDKSRYYIGLFSGKSVNKVGVIQEEFKYALERMGRYPPGKIYYLPVRLDNCKIPYRDLKEIHHIDLFPDWDKGMNQILRAISKGTPNLLHTKDKARKTQDEFTSYVITDEITKKRHVSSMAYDGRPINAGSFPILSKAIECLFEGTNILGEQKKRRNDSVSISDNVIANEASQGMIRNIMTN